MKIVLLQEINQATGAPIGDPEWCSVEEFMRVDLGHTERTLQCGLPRVLTGQAVRIDGGPSFIEVRVTDAFQR